MTCPDCGRLDIVEKCGTCGWKAVEDAPKRRGSVATDNPMVWQQCSFRTGSWQCRYTLRAPRRQSFVLCPIHDEGMRRGVTSTHDMLAILMYHRAAIQRTYGMDQFLGPEGLRALRRGELRDAMRPFEWQPLAACWRAISGLPLPDGVTDDVVVGEREEVKS